MALSCKTGCVCPPGTKRNCTARRQVPGSVSFVPPVAGYILAGEVIKDLIAKQAKKAATQERIAQSAEDMIDLK
jgi:tRNA A37 threonylcarbamoyladenosine dehydratase